jgi:hypothetical protein
VRSGTRLFLAKIIVATSTILCGVLLVLLAMILLSWFRGGAPAIQQMFSVEGVAASRGYDLGQIVAITLGGSLGGAAGLWMSIVLLIRGGMLTKDEAMAALSRRRGPR